MADDTFQDNGAPNSDPSIRDAFAKSLKRRGLTDVDIAEQLKQLDAEIAKGQAAKQNDPHQGKNWGALGPENAP